MRMSLVGEEVHRSEIAVLVMPVAEGLRLCSDERGL